MKNKYRIYIAKYTTYTVVFLILYVLQTTPRLFVIADVKPILLIPAAVCLAMFEGELAGGIYGALAGMLCDMAGRSFFGFYSIMLLAATVTCGLLIIYYLNPTMLNALVLTGATLLILCPLDYFFMFGMWDYDNVSLLLLRYTLPAVAYSIIITPLLFLLIKRLHTYFDSKIPS